MRGPGLAQLSRRRTPRTQEESLVGSIACVASCPVPERRVMATTRAASVCTSVHMVRTYTWPRTETNQRSNQSTNQPACSVNKDNDIATTTTRPAPNHARHATPTPATPTPRASRSAENAFCVCSENAFSLSFSFTSLPPLFVRCTFSVLLYFLSLSLSHLAPPTVSLPSFFEGLLSS